VDAKTKDVKENAKSFSSYHKQTKRRNIFICPILIFKKQNLIQKIEKEITPCLTLKLASH
jgi:hypothetical protein